MSAKAAASQLVVAVRCGAALRLQIGNAFASERREGASMDPRERAADRERMIERHLVARGIRDPGVLQAMREVPREAFIAGELAEFAYEDAPLPIEAGQTSRSRTSSPR